MKLSGLYDYFWSPSLYALVGIERAGITLDTARLEQAAEQAAATIETEEKALEPWTEYYVRQKESPMNWGSPAQRAEFFYDYKRFPIPEVHGSPSALKRNYEGKRTTDAGAVDWIRRQDDTAASDRTQLERLLRLQKATKLRQFMQALPTHVKASTGRLHCVLAPETETGRLSSRNPNLQNIPARNDVYGIRRAFVAAPGHSLVVADYSQLELYVLAHFIADLFGDDALGTALQAGDLHTEIARRCWPDRIGDLSADEVKADPVLAKLRTAAKAIIYGINYGKTAVGLGVALDVSTTEAQGFIDDLFEAYPGIARFQEHCIREAHRTGQVRTLVGRHRNLGRVKSDDPREVRAAERQALNTPIQGSAADIVTGAMLALNTFDMPDLRRAGWYNRELADLGARTLLQIHDEFIVEVPTANAERALPLVQAAMENPFRKLRMRFPLKVTAEIGQTWGDCK